MRMGTVLQYLQDEDRSIRRSKATGVFQYRSRRDSGERTEIDSASLYVYSLAGRYHKSQPYSHSVHYTHRLFDRHWWRSVPALVAQCAGTGGAVSPALVVQ
jgi:hypothetical protein